MDDSNAPDAPTAPRDGSRPAVRSDGDAHGHDPPPVAARVGVATAIIAAILAAFLYRVATGGSVPAWLGLVVSVLGVAAAAAVLGPGAVRTAVAALRTLWR